MALTVTPTYKWAWLASEFFVVIQVTGDSSYPVGGYPITPALFALNTFASTSDSQLQVPPFNSVGVWAENGHTAPGAGGYAEIDVTTGNMRLFTGAGVEVAGAATAVTYVVSLCVHGH